MTVDFLGRSDLLALGLGHDTVETLLRQTQWTGNRGVPVVAANDLDDLLAALERPEAREQ